MIVVYFGFAVGFGHYYKGWSFVTCIFFAFETFTTIGYGDHSFVTDNGHGPQPWWEVLVAIAFITLGINVVAGGFTLIAENFDQLMLWRQQRKHKELALHLAASRVEQFTSLKNMQRNNNFMKMASEDITLK